MFEFTHEQRMKALFWLSIFHIVIIASSNYLVQIPFSFFGIHSTWGAFTFPFIFLTTDLTIRVFGAPLARKIIFCVMFPALIISYVVSILFYDGGWMGFDALQQFNSVVGRIALASFTAYAIGQIMDIFVFNRLRKLNHWWIAPSAAAIFGNILDTMAFFSIAFYQSADPFMAEHWQELAIVDYCSKIVICALFFLPMYGVILNYLLKKLTTIHNSGHQLAQPQQSL